jgi:hypothetical protein
MNLNFFSLRSSRTKSTDDDEDQSITSSYTLENKVSKYNDTTEKCPICFMIFPQSMITRDRNLHVNEHYNND